MSRMTRRAFIRSTAYLAGGGMCALSTGSSLLMPVESWASHIAFQETSCGENHPQPDKTRRYPCPLSAVPGHQVSEMQKPVSR